MFDPATSGYLEVPYRDLSRPSISLWEHRLAIRRLREQNREQIDEIALFRAVTELRAIEKAAVHNTRSARRNQTRRVQPEPIITRETERQHHAKASTATSQPLAPFSEIEAW